MSVVSCDMSVVHVSEDPKAVSVVASVAVVGDGVKKEELDAANERGDDGQG